MDKNLKKQIKTDELATGVGKAYAWFGTKREELKVTLLVLAVLGVGAAALGYFKVNRDREAQAALGAALETFRAPVTSETSPNPQSTPPPNAFATSAEKYQKALEAFSGVENRYGSHAAGVRARYYRGLCEIELDKPAEAQKTLEQVAASRNGIDAAMARLALAGLHRRQGQMDKAVETYGQLAEDPSLPLPRDHALMALASTLEDVKRVEEAVKTYRRVIDDFPSSPYSSEARQRVEYLKAEAEG